MVMNIIIEAVFLTCSKLWLLSFVSDYYSVLAACTVLHGLEWGRKILDPGTFHMFIIVFLLFLIFAVRILCLDAVLFVLLRKKCCLFPYEAFSHAHSWIISFPFLCFLDFRTLWQRLFLFNLCSVSCHGNPVLTEGIKGKYHSYKVM